MYGSPYITNYPNGFNQQINTANQDYIAMIDKEKERLDKMKEQYIARFQQPQQPTLNQTIQVAPTPQNVGIKYINSIDEVQKELTIVDTPFITNDYSTLFIKNAKGEIKTFSLQEIVPIDERDNIIKNLQIENERLKGMIADAQSINASNDKPIEDEKSKDVPNVRTSKTKSK